MKYTRRIQLTGGSTYTVSLPSRWVKNASLSKGSEIELSELGNNLVLDPRSAGSSQKAKILMISKSVEESFLERIMTSLYISYFDALTIKTEDIMDQKTRETIKRFARRVMGVEIFEETSNSIVLQNVLNSETFTVWNAIRRMSLNVDTMISDGINAMKSIDRKMMFNIIERDDEVDRYQWYIFRETKASQASGESNVYALILSRILERMADHSVNICNAIIKAKKVYEKCLIALSEFLGSCYAMYKDSMSCFYSGNIEAMNAIIEKKKEVGQLKNNLLSSIDDDSLNLATAVSEEILRIGLYSTDIAELGMDYLLANEISFEIR